MIARSDDPRPHFFRIGRYSVKYAVEGQIAAVHSAKLQASGKHRAPTTSFLHYPSTPLRSAPGPHLQSGSRLRWEPGGEVRVVGADQGPTKYRGGAYRYDYGEEVGRVRDTLKGARQPDGSSWGEQRRVDESDPAGGAFTRAEFVALYGDTRVWDASRPAAHTPTTSWHAWRNKSARTSG